MATQEIVYKISADNKQAVEAFRQLSQAQGITEQSTKKLGHTTQGSNMMLMSTGRIVQDLPYGLMGVGNNITFLAEQFAIAKAQGTGFKESLRGMLGALKGPMGIIFAISTATSLLTIFGNKLFGLGGATEDAKKNVRSLRDEFFDLNKEVGRVTAALNFQQIEQMGRRKLGLTGLINKTQSELSLVNDPTERTKVSLLLAGYKSELEAINKEQEFQNFAFQKWLDMQKESTKTTKETKENYKEIEKILTGFSAKGERMTLAGSGVGLAMSDIMGKQGDKKGKAGGASITEGFAEQMMFVQSQIRETAGLLNSEFKTAWQDIFGEANSLFEKFMMNIASSFAELAGQNLMSGLLNLFLPGAGSAASALFNKPSIIQNDIIINDRQIATLYTQGKSSASRLRMN